ncbi:MAG: metallophosphoesterase [Gammaproteobacteria bacterium]|jgi:serine/threonine protein phosphatase 1
MAAIRRFEQNTAGTDYIVGDIHGCFDQLQSLVDAAKFDPAHDRLFSVGDLIDRGPHSPAAPDWLDKPWFHACLGNHEHMLLSSGNPTGLFNWMMNGAEWWLQQDEVFQERLRLAVSRLPLAMEVEMAAGRVGIVHADVPEHMLWQQFMQAIETGNPDALHVALWGRDRADGRVTSGVDGIDYVVCGHTITVDKQVQRAENVWFIDTGAYSRQLGGKLTMLALSDLFAGPPVE